MSAALFSSAPRESRRARERAQGATSYEDYVSARAQRQPGLSLVDDHPGSDPFPELPGGAARSVPFTCNSHSAMRDCGEKLCTGSAFMHS